MRLFIYVSIDTPDFHKGSIFEIAPSYRDDLNKHWIIDVVVGNEYKSIHRDFILFITKEENPEYFL